MKATKQPLVWQGRLQLGDEPGTFGDATYAGLTAELPITVHPMPGAPVGTKPKIELVLGAENMQVYAPPGHSLQVIPFVPVPGTTKWEEKPPILDERLPLTGDEFSFVLDLSKVALPAFLSVRLRCDITVAAGLYDDFVLTRLSAGDADFSCYAKFGFEFDAQ